MPSVFSFVYLNQKLILVSYTQTERKRTRGAECHVYKQPIDQTFPYGFANTAEDQVTYFVPFHIKCYFLYSAPAAKDTGCDGEISKAVRNTYARLLTTPVLKRQQMLCS